jgi:hypothetical protein
MVTRIVWCSGHFRFLHCDWQSEVKRCAPSVVRDGSQTAAIPRGHPLKRPASRFDSNEGVSLPESERTSCSLSARPGNSDILGLDLYELLCPGI